MKERILCFVLAAAAVMSCGGYAEAAKTVTEGGLKYSVSDSGERTLCTGYISSGGIVKYYSEGKQCVGWTEIKGKKYYFLKNGGYADGEFVIDGQAYIFMRGALQSGPYSPEELNNQMPAEKGQPDRLQFENGHIVNSFAASGGKLIGKKYLSDYAGMYWDSDKEKYVILLTSMKRRDFYAGLGGEIQEFEFRKAKYSRNYLEKISDACFDYDIYKLHKICWVEISDRDNRVIIKVTDEKKVKLLEKYLINKDLDKNAFTVEYEPAPEQYYDDE